MATQLQIRRGTTAQMGAFTGAEGELAVNTSTDTVHVHDGATAGGFALAKADGSNIGTYAGSFTTISASGAITGNVTGNLTGSVTGNVTGDVTGDLTGSILTAAQTNITSVGTLSALAVTGTATMGAMNVTSGLASGTGIGAGGANGNLRLYANGLQVVTVATTGHVGIGATSPSVNLEITESGSATNSVADVLRLNHITSGTAASGLGAGVVFSSERPSGGINLTRGAIYGVSGSDPDDDGALAFYTRTNTSGSGFSEKLRIDSAGNVGIGTSSAYTGGKLSVNGGIVQPSGNQNVIGVYGTSGLQIIGVTGGDNVIGTMGANEPLVLRTGSTEAFRITAARDMYFGQTTGSAADAGHIMQANGVMFHTADATTGMYLRRLNSDGGILEFRKNSTTVGSIGVVGGNNLYIHGDTIGLGIGDDNIYPTNSSGTSTDAATDIGDPSARFRNIYRSGSTYQTSDRNMKQDIRELTGAERNVAVAAKGLLKAFRFIDAVDRDGDSANIHFGIIAQELAEAFAAEGLDANDYQVYKTTVETDEYGNEQTKLNVCYENLLAFIISAI